MTTPQSCEPRKRSITETEARPDPQSSRRDYQRGSEPLWAQSGNYVVPERTPYTLPTPPVDEGKKCSLPPIKELLGFRGSGPSGWAPAARPLQPQLHSGWQEDMAPILNPRSGGAALNNCGTHSPTTPPASLHMGISQHWSSPQFTAPGYTFGPRSQADAAAQNMEREHRRSFASTNSTSSVQTATSITSYSTSATSAAASSPGAAGHVPSSYYSGQTQQHPPDLTLQRPAPLEFPQRHQPPPSPLSVASTDVSPTTTSTSTDLWQHHSHYLHPQTPHSSVTTPIASATFPQDRYVCPTCAKAFSRPSSLRIHSHSHTGEKPFRCPQKGCGKAFSVRSNMKRHERRCHVERRAGAEPTTGAGCREILPAGS